MHSTHGLNARRTLGAILLGVSAITFSACMHGGPPNDGATRAIAILHDTMGREVGNVRLTERPGVKGVEVEISIDRGATPGIHGIHFHSVGKCDSTGAFASAGPHFNPLNKQHGLLNVDGPHAGDLEAITVDDFRTSHFLVQDTRVTLMPGPLSLTDADGSSVVLHALPDDQRTDPAGNSGARIACGVIKPLTK
jgi:Cu-Zn family superoxide dismutase